MIDKIIIIGLIALLVYYIVFFCSAFVQIAVYYGRKYRHQKRWDRMKRKLEEKGKTEGEIREAYFEYCKKLVQTHRDCFGWGIPVIGKVRPGRWEHEPLQ